MIKKEVPVFVKIDDYKDILDIITLAREKLELAKNDLAKLKELNEQRNKDISDWNADLNQAISRLEDVDNSLLEPEAP